MTTPRDALAAITALDLPDHVIAHVFRAFPDDDLAKIARELVGGGERTQPERTVPAKAPTRQGAKGEPKTTTGRTTAKGQPKAAKRGSVRDAALALLEQGPATVGAIAEGTGCKRTVAQATMQRLHAQGLAESDGARPASWALVVASKRGRKPKPQPDAEDE